MVGKYFSVLFRPLQFLAYGLAGLVPRSTSVWVFGSWDGRRFADNAAALFSYTPNEFPAELQRIWISRKPAIVRQLRQAGFQAYLSTSLRGLYYCLRAGLYIYDGYPKDINYWASNGATKVALQHGPGGYKCIERDIHTQSHRLGQLFHGTRLQRWMWRILLPWHVTQPDIVICASSQQQTEAISAYGVSKGMTRLTGLPRNDKLFACVDAHRTHPLYQPIRAWQRQGKRVFLHLPTLRESYASPFPQMWEELDQWLGANDLHIYAHQHFAQTRARASRAPLANVTLVPSEQDMYGIFTVADGLITDFSSVAFDYLLTKKSIVHFIPDFQEYLDHCRELRLEFPQYACGPVAKSAEDLRMLLSSPLDSTDATRALTDQFHHHQDGGSSHRVYDALLTHSRCAT